MSRITANITHGQSSLDYSVNMWHYSDAEFEIYCKQSGDRDCGVFSAALWPVIKILVEQYIINH